MMAEVSCDRSMWVTLSAAASTWALFVAANWGSALRLTQGQNLRGKIFWRSIPVVVMPLLPLYYSLWNAMNVWIVRSSLDDEEPMPHPDSVAILTLCPVYVQADHAEEVVPGYRRVHSEELERHCPLELRPRPDASTQSSDVVDSEAATSHYSTHHKFNFILQTTYWYEDDIDEYSERAVFLSARLAPKDNELSFIRARNKFQSVVIALQAGGYLLSIIQRLVQHLAISPVEAIVSFLSIIVVLQLLMELYTCGNFQRPLLIHLDAHQYERFRAAPRKDLKAFIGQKKHMPNAFVFMLGLLISIPCIYYISHYLHTYSISAISVLLFFLAQTLLAFCLIFLQCKVEIVHLTLGACSWVLFLCSVIVAVVGSIVEWKAFHTPSHIWFSWIIPHVAS